MTISVPNTITQDKNSTTSQLYLLPEHAGLLFHQLQLPLEVDLDVAVQRSRPHHHLGRLLPVDLNLSVQPLDLPIFLDHALAGLADLVLLETDLVLPVGTGAGRVFRQLRQLWNER